MVDRPRLLSAIGDSFGVHPVVALLGPRQVGKTTLARQYSSGVAGRVVRYDLESATDRRRLTMPELALSEAADLVIIDEIQRAPELFEVLRVVVDRPDHQTRFLVLGSASPSLVKGVTESLAGRVGFVDVPGFGLDELGPDAWREDRKSTRLNSSH